MLSLRSKAQILSLVVSLISLVTATPLLATVPQTITFQGFLTDTSGDPLEDGSYTIRLVIYDAPIGGAVLWDAGAQSVQTLGGLFSYTLGANVTFPATLFSGPERYLGISIGADAELSPRIPFRSAPYALEASHTDSSEVALLSHTALTANQADSAQFAQVAGLALSANVSGSANLAEFADSSRIAVNANKLAGLAPNFYLDWNSITNMPSGFADGVDDGASFSAGGGLQLAGGVFSVAPSGITEQMIAVDAVTAAKIAVGAVGSSEVENNSLTATDLAANSVGTSEIANNSVTKNDMAPNSIGAEEIIAGTIDSSKIADSSITGANIAANSISLSHLQNSSFTANELLDEPGVAQVTGASFLTVPSLTTVSSLTITAPASGYVMALASFEMKVDHIFGAASQAIVGLSNTSSSLPSDQNKNVDIPSSANTGRFISIVSLQRIFFVNAGANTFYLLGRKTTSSSPIWSTFDVTFSLVYYPTAYGAVSVSLPVDPTSDSRPKTDDSSE